MEMKFYMNMKKYLKMLPAFLLILLVSCSEEQDFDQYKDLDIITDASGPVLYVESTEDLINLMTTPNFPPQKVNFDGFKTNFFADRVISGTVDFQIENTTSKQLEVTVDFLNDADDVIDSRVVLVPAAPPSVIINENFEYGPPSGSSIEIIKNVSSIQLSVVNFSGNTSVSSLPDPKVIFRSSASFKLRVIK